MKGKKKQDIPLRIRFMFLTRNWVWLFWLLLLPIVWILLPLERISRPITGFVVAETENIGALEAVRIRSIFVRIGQQVEPGDILFQVEGFGGAGKELEQARARAELDGLLAELARLSPLVAQGIISDIELTRIRPQIAALTKTLESYQDSNEVLADQFFVAKSSGRISHLQYAVGDIVPAGTPIMRIASLENITVTGILRPYQVELVSEGMALAIVPPNRSVYKRYKAEVTSIEPEILDFTDPFHMSALERFPLRGQRIVLSLKDNNHDLVPGEQVTVFLPHPTIRQKFTQLVGQIRWKIDEKKAVWE